MSDRPLLGVMVLAHARPWLLRAIREQAREIDPRAVVQFVQDRPTPEVRRVLLETYWAKDAPKAVLDHRENFMEIRNWQLDQLRPFGVKYACIWDDDHLLENVDEARAVLTSNANFDLVYATKRYLWDSVDTENTALPVHRSVFFFRVLEGDRFPLDRTINAPARIHDTATRIHDLTRPLLDIGYLTAAERERVWAAYKRAGKIDALTTGLNKPAHLRPVPNSHVLNQLRDLLK